MVIVKLLKRENINLSVLNLALKNIGLDILKINIQQNIYSDEFIKLLKETIKINANKTSNSEKDALKKKFNKFISANHSVLINPITEIEEKVHKNKQFNDNISKKIENKIISDKIKLAIVKFIDAEISHGFAIPISSFDEVSQHDFFNNMGIRLFKEDIKEETKKKSLIIYNPKINYNRSKGNRISTCIPLFIFNEISSKYSFASVLIDGYWEQQIELTTKEESGFAFVSLNYKSSSSLWEINCIYNTEFEKKTIKYFGRKLFSFFLKKYNIYSNEIQYIKEKLTPLLHDTELNSIYSDIMAFYNNQPIKELIKNIDKILSINIPESVINEITSSLNKFSFIFWANNKINKLPASKNQTELEIWKSEIITALTSATLQKIILKLLREGGNKKEIKVAFNYLLESKIAISSNKDFNLVKQLLYDIKSFFPDILIKEDYFKCKNTDYFFQLFQLGLLSNISEKLIKDHISKISTVEAKVNFIETFSENEIHLFYSYFPDLYKYYKIYLRNNIENELKKIPFICFDIESDKEEIFEFAWLNNFESYNIKNNKSLNKELNEFLSILNDSKIIVGHNIRKFDIPILKNYGSLEINSLVWDTLEIEMLLNPCRYSFALKTIHNAAADTLLTFNLFKNQVSRIIKSDISDQVFKEFLPPTAFEYIQKLKHNLIWNKIEIADLNKESDEFYRPISHSCYNSILNPVNDLISSYFTNLIIAPYFLWDILSHNFNFTFIDKNSDYSHIISKNKVDANIIENSFLKHILIQYIIKNERNNTLPYMHQLPTAIKLLLTPEQANNICDCNNELDFSSDYGNFCITPEDTVLIHSFSQAQPEANIIFIGKELYNLTNKIQLGFDFDFVTIFDCLKNEPIWLQMSGGKNFISFEKRQCALLGISDFPPFMQNIWMEKIGKGKFKIWCNVNFDNLTNEIKTDHFHYIPWTEDNLKKTNAFIVRLDVKKSAYIADLSRVNPESLYRNLYWVYQFKIFENIFQKSKAPKVLLVNDDLEIQELSAYARSIGYFIPDTNASLARQIEILHVHSSYKKLIILPLHNIEKVIFSNYVNEIDFILDSLMLYEKYQMLNGLSVFDNFESQLSETDDFKDDNYNNSDHFDLFKLIKHHQTLIDYYYKLIIDNHPESKLYLCDTRFTDYFGIETTLGTKSYSAILWNKKEEYDVDKEIASKFFKAVHVNAEVEFNIEEAKEILRHIFLTSDDGKHVHEWYNYQHPCLDDILPAKKDLLISLPTGAGKSLLFQGPALFRSAFSNKLSIVISPLRALMQDQVDALWNLGFFGNVEFLSADKSYVEIRDIYRRIAGGEIALLYITPERFRSRNFENSLLTRLEADSGLEFAVFDEAHCISQWGQEFRPDYLNAARKIQDYSKTPPFQLRKLLFSATISEQVFDEICTIMPGIELVEGADKNYNPVRDHISINFKHNINDDERLLEIANYLKQGSFNHELSRAIIFVKSRKKTEECALLMPECLRDTITDCEFSDKVGGFHAGMDAEDRKETYEKFKNGDIVILFATKAFGMGMDIPNIHFLSHYSPPGTFEDFLQEIGRAGRNEEKRNLAGFNNIENPIKSLCLTSNYDFAKLKDQLHESRISWHEIKEIKETLEKYVANFKTLEPDLKIPVAIPFNLYSTTKASVEEKFDNKFRIALHWLERLERIKLGYFTITHLEFELESLINLKDKVIYCLDEDVKNTCKVLLTLLPFNILEAVKVQISIASLRNATKLNLEQLFSNLIKAHNLGLLVLLQDVIIEPTKIRSDETVFYSKINDKINKYPALKIVFSFAYSLLNNVGLNDSKTFEGDILDDILKQIIEDEINFLQLPWSKKETLENKTKECKNYFKDIKNKRSKHAFTIIRLLGKTKHETKLEKVIDSNRKVLVRHTIVNGFHKEDEWKNKINQIERDCIKLLDFIANNYFNKNIKTFNWAKLISDLELQTNLQYFSDLLFILSVLGYIRTGGLLPSGIEVFINSIEPIDEIDIQSFDKKIYDEFEQTRKLRELKLITLQVLSDLDNNSHDNFIKKYFSCNSLESLLVLLEENLPTGSPILSAFREEAIKEAENALFPEQKKIYDWDANQHINVMAGPGSGKTHTLSMRVARLVHHLNIAPEVILVLAYNRAVVSELKERLGVLFNDLGYGTLAKRIKIYTFHGLAKKYCQQEIENSGHKENFKEWEKILLNKLQNNPGVIMNQLGAIQHILIDEFQDINNTRIDLLWRLNELTACHIFAIGDPNQSIYGYDREVMDPYHYYKLFENKFNPQVFKLLSNHRSLPAILQEAGKILSLPEDKQYLLPVPTRIKPEDFNAEYTEIIDSRITASPKWWDKITSLLDEEISSKPYKQIAILFRSNNEVYRGYQRIKSLNIPNIRIRIQGSLPYEFTRIRECHAVIRKLKVNTTDFIPRNYKEIIKNEINQLIIQNPNWNDFYLRVIHAIILDFIDDNDENQTYTNLIDFISELSYRDDGQLYKIYEKHLIDVANNIPQVEIVLTTMHKVKGLEFDCVVVTPSFSGLSDAQFEEEKRLYFVSYTRARYRLLIFKSEREFKLEQNLVYNIPAGINIGIPVMPEIKKINIGWAARQFNFNLGVNEFIAENVKSGDFIIINKRIVPNGGNPFNVHELYREGTNNVIGVLSRDAGNLLNYNKIEKLIVNEIVVWNYEDTIKFDQENPGRNYAHNWCQDAITQGYIYLVDFAGYGIPVL